MKRNFLQVLILFVFCTALYGDDYRLYLNRAESGCGNGIHRLCVSACIVGIMLMYGFGLPRPSVI